MLRCSSLYRYWPLLVLILFAGHNWFGPDVWYHLTWGREIVNSNSAAPLPHVLLTQPVPGNPSWAFQVFMYAVLNTGGPFLCSAFFIVIWVIIGARWVAQSGFRGDRGAGYLPIFLFIACVQLRLEYRPEVLSFLALIVLIEILNSRRSWSRKLILAGILEIGWANVHAYYVLGPLVAGLYVLGDLLDHGFDRARLGRGARLIGTMGVAALVSPTPVGSLKLVYHYARLSSELKGSIEELAPTVRLAWWYWPMPAYWVLFVIVVATGLFRLKRRSGSFAALVSLAGAVLSLTSFRNIPMLALTSAPVLNVYAEGVNRRCASTARRTRALALAGLSLGLAVGLSIVSGAYYRWLGSGTTFGLRIEPSEYPIGSAQFLVTKNFGGRIFNDPNDGGYLSYALPTATVLGDSYFVDARTTAEFFDSRNDPAVFERLNQKFVFDAAVINVLNLGLAVHLLGQPAWTLSYADFNRLVFLPTGKVGARRLDPATIAYTAGEDLRREPYLAAALAWAQLGLRSDPRVITKFIADVEREPRIPSGLIKSVFIYALLHRDGRVASVARAWATRSFVSERGDARAIEALASKLAAEGI